MPLFLIWHGPFSCAPRFDAYVKLAILAATRLKFGVDTVLFCLSFLIQRERVFREE